MKPKLAFIDHSFHKKTKSTYFLRDVLEKDFELLNIWDESWRGNQGITAEEINQLDCEYVLFFQVLPALTELKKINRKMIWVPMYDSCLLCLDSFWLELSALPIGIISFSEALSSKMFQNNIDVLNVKYYFDPKKFQVSYPDIRNAEGCSVFFWYRGPVKFTKIKRFLRYTKVKELVIKNDPDPGYRPLELSRFDKSKYNIKIITGQLPKEKYLQFVKKSDVFVAPRNFEGIGMSFLEPMAMGKVVIAPDFPTMNEYIVSGKNGFLYSSLNSYLSVKINMSEIGINTRKNSEAGYKNWVKKSGEIPAFIKKPYSINKVNVVKLLALKLVEIPIKVLRLVSIFITNH